jgi:hypothetical protein
MCCASKGKIIKVGVGRNEGCHRWKLLAPTPLPVFLAQIQPFRRSLSLWIEEIYGMKGTRAVRIPKKICRLIFRGTHADFHDVRGGFNVFNFLAVLMFFETNKIPLFLRKRFWCLIIDQPEFTVSNTCGSKHPYVILYKYALQVRYQNLNLFGCFWCLEYLRNTSKPKTIPVAWNIWGCCGIWNEGQSGLRRLVNMNLKKCNDDGEEVDWDDAGALTIHMQLRNPVQGQIIIRFTDIPDMPGVSAG